MKRLWRSKFLLPVLVVLLLGGLVFSFIRFARAVTPNPGHPWTEVGDGTFQVTGPTSLRTYTLPDANASLLTSASGIVTVQATKSANYTLTTSDVVVLADATGGAITLTLPTAAGNKGLTYFIKKIDTALTNLVNVDPAGSETIDGITVVSLAQRGESIIIQSDGTNWVTLARRTYDVSAYRTRGSTLNQWYTSPSNGTALVTGAPSINTLRAIPFIVSKATTIDQLAIAVTAAGTSSNARLGIYNDNGNNYPGTLVVDAGSQTTNAIAVVTFTTGLPVTLDPGLYWLAIVGNGTAPTIRTFGVANLTPVLGYASTLPANAQFGWSVAFTFGALPTPFTAGGAPITAVPIPAIFARTSI